MKKAFWSPKWTTYSKITTGIAYAVFFIALLLGAVASFGQSIAVNGVEYAVQSVDSHKQSTGVTLSRGNLRLFYISTQDSVMVWTETTNWRPSDGPYHIIPKASDAVPTKEQVFSCLKPVQASNR